MKFGQLREYNMRSIYIKKPYTKCCGETIPRPFPKKLKLSISLDQYSKVLYSLFVLHVKTTLAFNSYKAFLKNKKISGTSLPALFSAWFLKKKISLVIFYYLTKFSCLVSFTCEIFCNMCIAIVY